MHPNPSTGASPMPNPGASPCRCRSLSENRYVFSLSVLLLEKPKRRSLDQCDERLAFFDDIRGELRRVDTADVLRRVDRSGRDEQDLASLERHRRLALELILQQSFDNIDDLLARMAVIGCQHPGADIDAHLDDLASRDTQIMLLQIGTLDSWLLRLRQTVAGEQHRYRYGHHSN